MLHKGAAKKVTIYINEDTKYHGVPLYQAILNLLLHKGVAGATASRAMAGYGAHQTMHTTKIEVLSEHLPLRVEFVETAEKVDEILPALYDIVTDGLIEVQDTEVVKIARKEKQRAEPKLAHAEKRGKARLMRIYLGEGDKWHDERLFDAIVKRLRMMDIAGATVYRGILGYGANGHTHKQGRLHLSHDLPVMISVVDQQEKLDEAVEAIKDMMTDGLIVFSDVDIIRLVHSHPLTETSNANV